MIRALLVGSGGGAACAGGGAGAAAGFISAAGGGTGAGAGWDESEGSVCKGCNGPILIVSTGSWAWASKETMTSAEIRMTKECQNPNDEGVPKPRGGAVSSCFVIRDSFVILNLSFVISLTAPTVCATLWRAASRRRRCRRWFRSSGPILSRCCRCGARHWQDERC